MQDSEGQPFLLAHRSLLAPAGWRRRGTLTPAGLSEVLASSHSLGVVPFLACIRHTACHHVPNGYHQTELSQRKERDDEESICHAHGTGSHRGLVNSASAAELTASLTKGTPELKSAGPLAFGPEGILFVGDTRAATIFAIATEDTTAAKFAKFKVEGVNEKIANLLGIDAKQLAVNDMATNPISGNIYFLVSRGKGNDAKPAIVKVDPKGKLSEFPLKDVMFSKVSIANPPAEGKNRQESITQVAFVKDRVYVAGLSNEDFASKLRSIPFPFKEADKGTSIEIYHGAHGRIETASPVRTFVACEIDGQTNILAAYTCTPLVRIPVSDLKPGVKVKGTTVAELGNMNRPLDMIVYQKDGKEYLLLANSARGVMKIPTEGLDKVDPIKSPIKGGATGGQGKKIEKIEALKDVQQLDKYGKSLAVVLVGKNGPQNLEVIDLP